MARFFTSDLHFNHDAIIGYCDRPFDTVEEMNEALITYWNETVTERDEVYLVGDAAMGKQRCDALTEFVARMHGHIVLIPGNHDYCWPGRHAGATLDTWIGRYTDAGFDVVDTEMELRLADGTWVDLCHFPYSGDHTQEVRYREFRPKDRGRWLLHGHIHEGWLQLGRQINVGVDVWDFRPVPEDWIIAMIAAGEHNLPEVVPPSPIDDIVIEWTHWTQR